jgi:hypothetical protein
LGEGSPLPFLGGGRETGMLLAGRPWPGIRRSKDEKIRGEAGGTTWRHQREAAAGAS